MESIKSRVNDRVLEHCNFIKCTLMFFVILYHSSIFWGGNTQWFNQMPQQRAILLDYITPFLGNFHIYAFTVISGYLYAYLKYTKARYKSFCGFIKKKVERLLLPFVAISLLWAAPIYAYFWDASAFILIKKFLLGAAPAQLWFVLMLFNVFTIAYFILDKLYQKFFLGMIISLLIFCLGIVFGKLLGSYFQISAALQFFLYFWIGTQLYRKPDNLFARISPVILIITYITCLLLSKYIIGSNAIYKLINLALHLSSNIIGALAAFYVLLWVAERVKYQESKVYLFFEKYNFTMYMIHQQIIYFFLDALNGKCKPVLAVIIIFVFVSLISGVIAWFLGKNKIIARFVGL